MFQRIIGSFIIASLLVACSGQQTSTPTSVPATTPVTTSTATTLPSSPAEMPTMPATAVTVQSTALPNATTPTTITFQQPPEWAQGSVIYQLFPRVFTPQGTLAAATERLPELRDLGVDIVYLLPIQPIGKEQRKGQLGSPYSISDYRAVNPEIGTAEDFKAFVDKAHELGMYVIMDFVANHTAWDNPLTTEHPDWYTHNSAGQIIPPDPAWTDVADLNYDSPELRQYMIDTSLYWVENFGVDGFRCDVSERVPSDFWQAWRAALKAKRSDLLLLSESEGLQMYQAGFEVAYDWTTRQSFISGLLAPNLSRQALSNISFEQTQYGPQLWRMRYLENHDQDRIASVALDSRQRNVAAAFLLTIPGLPLVYNGQEVGATVRPTLFDKFTVDFAGGDQSLRETYKTLIKLRNQSPALRSNTFERVTGTPRSVLMYKRTAPDQQVVVLINMDDQPALAKPENLETGSDAITGEPIDFRAGVQLEAFGYLIVKIITNKVTAQ